MKYVFKDLAKSEAAVGHGTYPMVDFSVDWVWIYLRSTRSHWLLERSMYRVAKIQG